MMGIVNPLIVSCTSVYLVICLSSGDIPASMKIDCILLNHTLNNTIAPNLLLDSASETVFTYIVQGNLTTIILPFNNKKTDKLLEKKVKRC